MKMTPLQISDVLLVEPTVFGDERGFFMETYRKHALDAAVGRSVDFVQDNHSRSARHVLRGLHYQIGRPQGKLVRVVEGEVFDVAVDLRKSSPTFGKWVGAILSAQNQRQLWVPEGFAHGFVVLSEFASSVYKSTDYYAPECERCLQWDDPVVGVEWPLARRPILSPKDSNGVAFADAEMFS
ncbi:dTDP-4-dehydrorhamnose 3,5-epimerase [Achromobacter xylosoxidans]|uniref:dTDP-4-dehydrorhamnose 3,5-epimerase n=1 Tax=Alcaligenes xylosoxydans xylosoxydans TaxID=85698 RepID=UPI00204238D2|nr:dTDP-4-dehydrorhamnose 3,5-epimerase [Achromobacter xylosoxidans]MCM2570119.1 dTDP-4-dehydrorhamnose 3,5-epimerase [Achromobacter xylosoxidans]